MVYGSRMFYKTINNSDSSITYGTESKGLFLSGRGALDAAYEDGRNDGRGSSSVLRRMMGYR